jgi:hypothetical protein
MDVQARVGPGTKKTRIATLLCISGTTAKNTALISQKSHTNNNNEGPFIHHHYRRGFADPDNMLLLFRCR